MPVEKNELRDRKYQAIREEYQKLSDKKLAGTKAKLYSQEAIFEKLSKKFFLRHRTLENIVFHRVSTKTKTDENEKN